MKTKNYKIKIQLALVLFFLYSFVFAETSFRDLSKNIYEDIFTIIIDLSFVAAFIFFTWGILSFIWFEGERKESAKDVIFWGVVALTVMASVWGLVRILNETFFEGKMGGDGQEFFDEFNINQVYEPDLGGKIK